MLLKSRTTAATCATAAMLILALGAVAPAAAEQESKSSTVAKELTAALAAAKLDSIAAANPTDPTSFVAALYFEGVQLLVVSAKYSAPSLLVTKIGAKEYRDVYIDLQSASVAGSKIFVQDQLADGLVSKPDGDAAADVWEAGSKTTAFDGDWKTAKLSEADYVKTFSEADERYTEMLTLLLGTAKGKSGS